MFIAALVANAPAATGTPNGPPDVQRIRELAPTMSRSKLAKRYGVSKRLVVQIVLGAR
jgi:hypothetical protein